MYAIAGKFNDGGQENTTDWNTQRILKIRRKERP
jgi:hypothetical protein